MNPPSRSRRRLLISLGLLGLAGVLFQPVHRLMEVRRGARKWAEKWPRSPGGQAAPDRISPPENGSRVPTLIEDDLTLNKEGSPWVIADNVVITSAATVTIEAGSEIFIGRENYLTVYGRILANGSVGNPVRLRAWSSADADKWAGMLIIQTSTPSIFQHVEFENSYYGADLVHATGIFNSCSFMNVREVCTAFKSETVFRNCLIDYKDYPGQGNINVFKFQNGSAHIEGCTIYNPDSDYKVDGIDADYVDKGIFRGNQLYGGICPGADAIDIGEGSRNILIENNIITDFVDKGISVGEGADIVINNNIIARCAMGAGIKDSAHAKITRTTFYGNGHAIKCYEKITGQGGGHATVDNCILAGSQVAPFEIDNKSSIRFTSTLCDQQLLPGKDNLQGSPEFEDIGTDRFNCIRITRTDSPAKTGALPCASFGASIDPYPTRLPKREHA
jgi:hypothetical protein